MRQQVVVEVLATQEGVAVRGLNLEHALLDLENRDIEGTATQVENGDNLQNKTVIDTAIRRKTCTSLEIVKRRFSKRTKCLN